MIRLVCSLIGLAASLSGCGGGTAAGSLSGRVLDGYLSGASVCLDLNHNQVCDAGERVTTTRGGNYTIDTSELSAAEIAATYIVANVPVTALDDNDHGQTLAQAGKPAYTLMAPTSTASTIAVTPLTTLVSQQLAHITATSTQWCEPFWWCSFARRMLANPAKNLEHAQTAVKKQLGIAPDVDLMQDYIAANAPPKIRNTATITALALGNFQTTINARSLINASEQQKFAAAIALLNQHINAILNNAAINLASQRPPTALNVAGVLIDSGMIPTATISTLPAVINAGQRAVLSWSSTVATICTADDAWSGTPALSGSMTITPTHSGINFYTLKCVDHEAYTGNNGFVTKSAKLSVYPAGYSSYNGM